MESIFFCEECGAGYRYNTRMGHCLSCGKGICVKCTPDHACSSCTGDVPTSTRLFYFILAWAARVLLVAGRVVLIIGLLTFAILKIFFSHLEGTYAFWFLVSGFIGWSVSGILVPIMNTFWKVLPKFRKKKSMYDV